MYLARRGKREKKEKDLFENILLKETGMGKKFLNNFLSHFPAISGFGDFLTLLELKPYIANYCNCIQKGGDLRLRKKKIRQSSEE